MRVELLPYQTYHTARVSWAKTIPLSWETGWLGECSSAIQTGPFGSQLHATEYVSDGIPVINPSNIVQGCVAPDWEITVDDDKAAALRRHRFKLGDIVFARRGEMGRCAPIRETEVGWLCGTGSMLVRLKAYRLMPEFAALLLSQAGVRDTLSLESVGATMDNLNTRILAKIRIPVPPIQDQLAILAFLDRETAKIDRLMAVRRKQVERLQEQRTAVIHHAVTQGLDPSAKMKPSGVEWLGDVPSLWHVIRMKFFANLRSGDGITSLDFDDEGVFPVYGGNGVRGFANAYTHSGTFVLIGRQGALCGNVHLVEGNFWASEHAVVAKLRRDINAVWFASILRTMNLNQYSVSAAQPGLAVERIQNLHVPVPPVFEQAATATFINGETAKLDTLITKYQRELELLAEYRASLISHAVTGKIDVRGLV